MNRRPFPLRLRADRRAATAIEFALVCLPFVAFLLAVMAVGLHFYLQQALDYATQQAVRQVQLGRVPVGYVQADFVNKVLCPAFSAFQNCANLYVDLRPVTDYAQLANAGGAGAPDSGATTGPVFCPGKAGQLMYAHIVYLAPSFGGSLLGLTNDFTTIVANAAFAIENPTGVEVVQVNGC
jgi:Flp pilus assembly protein TadG